MMSCTQHRATAKKRKLEAEEAKSTMMVLKANAEATHAECLVLRKSVTDLKRREAEAEEKFRTATGSHKSDTISHEAQLKVLALQQQLTSAAMALETRAEWERKAAAGRGGEGWIAG